MFHIQVGRPPFNRTIQLHPAWLLGPLGLAGCLAVGLAMGRYQSLTLAVLMVGAGLAAFWVGLVMIRPEWALLFYTFAAVNLNGVDLPFSLAGVRLSPDVVLTALMTVGVLLRALQTRSSLTKLPISAPYLVFLAVPIVTLFWSPVPMQSVKGVLRFVGYYALIWLIVDVIRTRQQVMRMVTALILSPVIPILIGFYQAFSGGGQTIWAGAVYNRIYGLAGGPFTLAFYLVLMIPLAMVFFLAAPARATDVADPAAQRAFKRSHLFPLLAGCMATLLLTFIRGSWIALMGALVLLGAVRFRRLLITVPAAVVVLLWAYAPAQSRLIQTLDPNSTLFGRLTMWRFAWEWIRTSPLVGVGMKAFEYYYILLAGPLSSGGLERRGRFLIGNRPHNELIGFVLDVGVVGTIALIVALVIIVRIAIRIYRQGSDETLRLLALAFLISSAGMFAGAMGDNVFSQPTVAVYFWLMAGLIMAIDKHMTNAEFGIQNSESGIERSAF